MITTLKFLHKPTTNARLFYLTPSCVSYFGFERFSTKKTQGDCLRMRKSTRERDPGPKKRQRMSLELFTSIGLSESKAKETLANSVVSKSLENVINKVSMLNSNGVFYSHYV